ncbi:MAG: hypothetical protein ACXVBZ_09350 [Flavisolibacter sp.]
MKKQVLIAVLVVTVITSCTKSSVSSQTSTSATNVTCTGTKSFSTDVSPIIQNVCAASGCHNSTSTNGPGPLTTYQQVFDARTQIRSAVSTGLMPKNGTLTSAEKAAILCWIDAGASNN